MSKQFWIWTTLALLVSASPLVAQDTQDGTQQSVPQDVQQSYPSSCPDGTQPSVGSDGRMTCQTSSDPLRQSSGLRNRPDSTGDLSNDTEFGSSLKQENNLRRTPPAPEPLTEFQKFVAATTGQYLPIYGAKLFQNVPTTFVPSNLVPVPSDYLIGPDDELRIHIWGQVNYSGNVRVDRSGAIHLPEVGSIQVAGLPFSALDQHLRSAVARIYRNFDLSVDMGRIRSIQIYVTGQARRPGVYTVSSLSSLVDALFASGGPSPQGSMRHLELRRNGKVVTDFDLYQLLIFGDKSKDVPLLPEDVLYIPSVGPQIAITGSIQNPAIYELRGVETLGELIDIAGKTTTVASNNRVSVERLGDHQVRQAMEVAMDKAGLNTTLAGGDIIRVFSIVPNYQNTITLRGDVANPGRFAWHDGMHISDLIPDRDSLLSRDYWWKRNRLGLPTPEFEPDIANYDPNQQRQRRYPFEATDRTRNNPDYNQTQSSTEDALMSTRPNSLPGDATGAAEDGGANDNSNEREYDKASSGGGSLASRYDQTTNPGVTSQTKRTEVRLSAPEIDWSYAVIERFDHETLKTSLIPFDLGKLVLDHDASQNLALKPGDTITIFSQADLKVPLEEQTKYVRLEGEFVHSGVYSVHPGETLRDLVRRAGGLTDKAYLYGSEFDRESTRVLQQQRIDEYVRRVDLDSSRGTLALTASATSSAGSVANTSAATAAELALLSRLKQIRATGRIVLTFKPDSHALDEVPNISLENGDKFTVPPAPATVNVVGAVYDQNSFLYRDHRSAGHYLQMAGGPDRDADWRHTFVIRADGSVVSRESVKGFWGNDFKDLTLNPGDTIVIPDKTLRPTALRGLLDWTQIFSQLAIGAAAVEVLK
jgi:protein involved in polysaccharide export with SLBB domain